MLKQAAARSSRNLLYSSAGEEGPEETGERESERYERKMAAGLSKTFECADFSCFLTIV